MYLWKILIKPCISLWAHLMNHALALHRPYFIALVDNYKFTKLTLHWETKKAGTPVGLSGWQMINSMVQHLQHYSTARCHDVLTVNTLASGKFWSSDTIWRQRSGSTLAQVMACCLTAPSHYLNQCWLIISKLQWHSYQGNFTRDASTTNH